MDTDDDLLIMIVSNSSDESSAEVELISEIAVRDEADAVKHAVTELGLRATEISISDPFAACEQIKKSNADVVFNLCEGLNGDSAFEMHVAAIWELSGIPFTGNNPLTLGTARNKTLSKKIFRSSSIPTPKWEYYRELPQTAPSGMRFPLIAKPACEDASLGIFEDAVVRDFDSLKRNVGKILEKYPLDGALVEEFIDGREFNVALVSDGNSVRALPPSEIDFSNIDAGADKITSYEAKWLEDHRLYKATPSRCPANISEELETRLQAIALDVHEALGANSYGRVDFRVDGRENIYVLEYNPNPDISHGAGFSKALDAAGIKYCDFVRMAVDEARMRGKRCK